MAKFMVKQEVFGRLRNFVAFPGYELKNKGKEGGFIRIIPTVIQVD